MPRRFDDGTLIPVRCAVIWYADPSRPDDPAAVTSRAYTPEEWSSAPTNNVVLVQVLYNYVLRGKWLQEVLHGYDLYWLRDGSFFTGNARHLPPGTPPEMIKEGVQILDRQFHVTFHNAANEGVPADPVA